MLLIGMSNSYAQGHSYIKKFKPLTESLSKEFGIPYAIIMGVSIIESGMGKSKNCKLLNNYFGIVGKNKLRRSKTKTYRSMFKQYPDAEASFRDFCHKMSKKKFYDDLKGNDDYHKWINAMSKSGYSESPKIWRKLITQAIKQYKLAVVSNNDEQPELPQKDTTLDNLP